jgi:hypothetical protein
MNDKIFYVYVRRFIIMVDDKIYCVMIDNDDEKIYNMMIDDDR